MNTISICLSSSNSYAQHLGATVASVLKSKNSDEFINVYVIDGGIDEQNKANLLGFEQKFECKIVFVKPDSDKLANCLIFKGERLSIATYYRLLIPELIPNEDRILYLDSDIIVRKSLKEFYDMEFGENLILGVQDIYFDVSAERLGVSKYINAGVLLLNCKQMRAENTVNHMFNWLVGNMQKVEAHDQDIINASLEGRIEFVDDKFNAQVYRETGERFSKIEDPVILHFISAQKPWTLWKPLNSTRWAVKYFEALEGTPWEGFIKEYNRKAMFYLPLRAFYPTGFVKTIIKNIFSVRSCGDKKSRLITILGLKFRVKRVKFVKK